MNPVRRLLERYFHHRGNLDEGLAELHSNLGLDQSTHTTARAKAVTVTTPTEEHARPVIYAPDMDGQADPGEVIWYHILPDRYATPELRACIVVGRNRHTLLGMLISSNPDHDEEDNWVPIGAGLWDPRGNECWARADRIIEIPEADIQRRGVSMPERRYDRIAATLRDDYQWT
ncbi:MAG TPA: type II toxin-antitoxin system PemK/MazF family toxin [Candidatus Corynebacterium avicola]|uniref:Type II toxin-antitoxin system PemK/MazF family toxin n=1 Tax=Candidatus Corynebacterium avicola TaxID=2838527 RepID=A0A9D1RQT9_9CORY|nr:type II toxin-antitoxin system PemK/MazF family toxin [Candidatus Corynebacterium avicola]